MTRPLARPTTLSRLADSGRTWATSGATRRGTDAPLLAPPSRISTTHLDQIASDLCDTDWTVAEFLADVKLASGQQLARRLWSAQTPTDPRARAARRALGR